MPKPILPSRGKCRCRYAGCGKLADVKRAKNHDAGALFLVCPVHGVDRAQGAKAQRELDAWVTTNQGGAEPGPEQGPVTVDDLRERGSIERGPKPETYPEGVHLEKPGQKRARTEPEPGPKPGTEPRAEQKREQPQPEKKGGGVFGWLVEGLEELAP